MTTPPAAQGTVSTLAAEPLTHTLTKARTSPGYLVERSLCEHQLLLEFHDEQLAQKIVMGTLQQGFTGKSAVTFIWTTIPYRMEWRYDIAAHKVIALDAGHVCQNLYLACEAIGAGTCGIAAYHQELMDALIRVDGNDEFTVYLAAVGKV